MHPALRSSLTLLAAAAAVSTLVNTGCETHDREFYTTHRDKNLHTPNPWAPSTTGAADEATQPLGIPPEPMNSANPAAPATPAPAPGQ